MIVGFDVCHDSNRRENGVSWGAMVATSNETMGKYYSVVSQHDHRNELSSSFSSNIISRFLRFNVITVSSLIWLFLKTLQIVAHQAKKLSECFRRVFAGGKVSRLVLGSEPCVSLTIRRQ